MGFSKTMSYPKRKAFFAIRTCILSCVVMKSTSLHFFSKNLSSSSKRFSSLTSNNSPYLCKRVWLISHTCVIANLSFKFISTKDSRRTCSYYYHIIFHIKRIRVEPHQKIKYLVSIIMKQSFILNYRHFFIQALF